MLVYKLYCSMAIYKTGFMDHNLSARTLDGKETKFPCYVISPASRRFVVDCVLSTFSNFVNMD